jgi:stage II sporulation protein GA (sporulation sigma-E factor processing peptidase)
LVTVYVDVVMGLNFVVDFLLILSTNRLAGYPPGTGRAALAAVLGGIYGGTCLMPGFRFLGNTLWRLVSLGVIGTVAFGIGKSMVRRLVLFVLLSMALGGIAMGLGRGGLLPLLLSASLLSLMCVAGFQGKVGSSFVPVELSRQGKTLKLIALRDTGNTLKDPLTGESVLVMGAFGARILLGLTPRQVEDPVGTVVSCPGMGLRLIPYRAVGSSCGMLLAARMDQVRIDGKNAGTMVAFTADGLSAEQEYQALIGGAV